MYVNTLLKYVFLLQIKIENYIYTAIHKKGDTKLLYMSLQSIDQFFIFLLRTVPVKECWKSVFLVNIWTRVYCLPFLTRSVYISSKMPATEWCKNSSDSCVWNYCFPSILCIRCWMELFCPLV